MGVCDLLRPLTHQSNGLGLPYPPYPPNNDYCKNCQLQIPCGAAYLTATGLLGQFICIEVHPPRQMLYVVIIFSHGFDQTIQDTFWLLGGFELRPFVPGQSDGSAEEP